MRMSRPEFQHPAVSTPSLDGLREAQVRAANLAEMVGKLNPRRPGMFNELIQAGKRTLARALDWALRPQRDFNRDVVEWMIKYKKPSITKALDEFRLKYPDWNIVVFDPYPSLTLAVRKNSQK